MKHYLSLLFCLLICASSMAQGKGKVVKQVVKAAVGKAGVELVQSSKQMEKIRRQASRLNTQTVSVAPVRVDTQKLITSQVKLGPRPYDLKLSPMLQIRTQWLQLDTIAFAFERLVAHDTTGRVFQLPSLSLKLHKDSAAVEPVFVHLGLPSGTLWKSHDEPGFFSQSAKDSLYAGQLPTVLQFYELWKECTWTREQLGYRVEGKNGNHIMMPSYAYCASNGREFALGQYTSYWLAPDSSSNTVYYVFANMKKVGLAINSFRTSRMVRLVQNR
jgi:hypothetical protein